MKLARCRIALGLRSLHHPPYRRLLHIQLIAYNSQDSFFKPLNTPICSTRSRNDDQSSTQGKGKIHGVHITVAGQIRITDTSAASRRLETALIVRNVSTQLRHEDFHRALPSDASLDHAPLRIVIGRDQYCTRLPYYILLFASPTAAASYQARLSWLQQNALRNLPVNPLKGATDPKRKIAPPEGWFDEETGEDIGMALRGFTLGTSVKSIGMMPPFPAEVQESLGKYLRWNSFRGETCWSVRVHMSGTELNMDGGRIQNLISGLQMSKLGITQALLDWETMKKERGPNWILRFKSEEAAAQFWWSWHRKDHPEEPATMIYVDPLW